MRSICTSIVATLVICATTYAQPAQWSLADGGNGHWYLLIDAPMSFDEAQSAAQALGGHLASIHSLEEHQFIVANFHNEDLGEWIGAYQNPEDGEPNSGWKWTSGEEWTYTNWAPGEPNNYPTDEDAALMAAPNGQWRDNPTSLTRPCIVEWDYLEDGFIINGSFEVVAGTDLPEDCDWRHIPGPVSLPGWDVVSNPGNVAIFRIPPDLSSCSESWSSFHGDHSVDLNGPAGEGGEIETVVPTSVGRLYQLRFMLTGNCGTTSDKIVLVTAGMTSVAFTHTCVGGSVDETWSEHVVNFCATDELTTIAFQSKVLGVHGPVIDAVSLIDSGPIGTCCINGACVPTTADGCLAADAIWLGEGGTCADCPASCMGDTDGNGVVNIEDLLNMLGSWGACP